MGGIEIPEAARMTLLQEHKFKTYFNEPTHMLREHHRVMQMVKPIVSNLMKSHLDNVELQMRPGMVTLLWTSINIDGYIRTVWRELGRLEQLIAPVNDVVGNRIDANLTNVSHVLLVDLPEESHLVNLSNSPGDTSMAETTVGILRKTMAERPTLPIFGICLGHQLLALAAGRVQSACWFTLDDGPNSGEFPPEDDFGLLAYDPDHFDEVEPERKPAFIALRTFLAEVGDMVVVGDVAASLSLGEDHRALMLARKDGNARAHVLWTPFERGSRFADVPRAANADVRVVDVFGRTQTVDPGSASVSVEYGPIPTLVVETRR